MIKILMRFYSYQYPYHLLYTQNRQRQPLIESCMIAFILHTKHSLYGTSPC